MACGILAKATVATELPDITEIYSVPVGAVFSKVKLFVNIDAGQRAVVYAGDANADGAILHIEATQQSGIPLISHVFVSEEILLGRGQKLYARCWGSGNVEIVVMGETR